MKNATKLWLELAEKDLKAARVLASDDFLANVALFHAQQCVEKCLKALLEEIGRPVPKTHSIQRLHALVVEALRSDPFLAVDDIDFLDSIYIDTRYPSSFGLLPSGMPNSGDAERGLEIAERLYKQVYRRLDRDATSGS